MTAINTKHYWRLFLLKKSMTNYQSSLFFHLSKTYVTEVDNNIATISQNYHHKNTQF